MKKKLTIKSIVFTSIKEKYSSQVEDDTYCPSKICRYFLLCLEDVEKVDAHSMYHQ